VISRVEPKTRGLQGPSVRTLSIRVALAAAGIVGVAYLLIATIVAVAVTNTMTSDLDHRLTDVLHQVSPQGGPPAGPFGGFDPGHVDPRGLPVLAWRVDTAGTATPMGLAELALPAEDRDVTDPVTVGIDGGSYRIAGVSFGGGRLVVGQSTGSISQTQSTLIAAELGIGSALLLFVFLGSVAVGRRVALPVERSRQRQLEFTADASHELRTPLSVIEAQATLALARGREAKWDREAFERIDGELKRTRRLVDDMLWLARFDSTDRQPQAEPVDVNVLAAQTADRFAAVAEARGQALTVHAGSGHSDAIVTAPPEWLDRLVGVLLDNACKYSPDGGAISISVVADGKRVRLTVDDSGPGIPDDQRGRVFDRFHRATDAPGGAGLGLAIADAIARATGGRWHIGTSAAGGASISVSWTRSIVSGRSDGRGAATPA
jgi:signal transduction histidine kinase